MDCPYLEVNAIDRCVLVKLVPNLGIWQSADYTFTGSYLGLCTNVRLSVQFSPHLHKRWTDFKLVLNQNSGIMRTEPRIHVGKYEVDFAVYLCVRLSDLMAMRHRPNSCSLILSVLLSLNVSRPPVSLYRLFFICQGTLFRLLRTFI